MFDTLVSFEPTFTLNGIPILPGRCQAFTRKRIAEEDKRLGCGDPPSIARSQKAGADILGIVYYSTKEQSIWTALLYNKAI